MNQLTQAQRARIVACLVEGNSMRATQRITGVAKKTVERVLREAGENCRKIIDEKMVRLQCQQIQCDEIWSFIFCKARTALKFPGEIPPDAGDSWCWIAIDPVSKIIPAWHVGRRNAEDAYHFMRQVEKRLANRVQLTTDGHQPYLVAVKAAFLARSIDYAMLVKIYGESGSGKYSPGECIGATKETVMGHPDPRLVCTSHAERQNLTMRMQMRRFTRLTNAFSKSLPSHKNALALHFAHYNLCRIHQTLRVTPAMEAGITDHVWSLEELLPAAQPRTSPLATVGGEVSEDISAVPPGTQ
jgi:IS1 family transposase/lambda repressor-like predicted transcriptional regulator